MLLVSLAIIIVAFILVKIYSRHGKEYVLPNLVGENIEIVRENDSLGLQFVVIDSIYVAGDDGGRILTQDPEDSTMVKKGRKVYVTITAYAPEDAVMPNLTDGTSLRQAISSLESVGLQGGRLTFVDSPYKDVLNQTYKGREVAAGQKLPKGAFVDLVVGKGDKVVYGIVPFVLNKNSLKARRDILSASLNVGTEHFSGVKDRSRAVVYRQEPEYTGVSRYELGTSVDLWYCDPESRDVEGMARNFKVDSSKIVNPEEPELPEMEDDFFDF